MKTRYARQIRTGINARCEPYRNRPEAGSRYPSGLDWEQMFALREAYSRSWTPLARRAFLRTKTWKSVRDRTQR